MTGKIKEGMASENGMAIAKGKPGLWPGDHNMPWQLIVEQGKRKRILLPCPSLIWIGRDPECQIRPAAATVDRRHCLLKISPERLVVADGQTKTGTFVNGQRIDQERELQPGDRLQVGPIVFEVSLALKPITTPKAEEEAAAQLFLEMDEQEQNAPAQAEADQPRPGTRSTEVSWQDTQIEQTNKAPGQEAPRRDTAGMAGSLLNQYLRRPGAVEQKPK